MAGISGADGECLEVPVSSSDSLWGDEGIPTPKTKLQDESLWDEMLWEDEDVELQPSLVSNSPLSPEEAANLIPSSEGGMIWHARLQTSCTEPIKLMRGNLPIEAEEFFESLVQTPDGRWLFCSAGLNGWPGLSCLELRSLTSAIRGVSSTYIERTWEAESPERGVPVYPEGHVSVRATLRAASWTSEGWSECSPGWLVWHIAMHPQGARVLHGKDILNAMQEAHENAYAIRAHVFAHRFAKRENVQESTEDRLTYHSAVVVEWDHGQFMTVIELGRLNMVGASRGRSTWYPATEQSREAFYNVVPDCMKQPWVPELAEIRCSDIPATSIEEFNQFVKQHTGPGLYFLDPHWHYSGDVRLSKPLASREMIARYLLNYMGRDRRYSKIARNCQYFAADLYSFLAGKKGVQPFSSMIRAGYNLRSHLFLYEPTMYERPQIS